MSWQIEINSDSTIVYLNLKRMTSQDKLDYEEIISALQDKNIPVNPKTESHISQIVEQLAHAGDHEERPVLIQAELPTNGQDGRFEWSEMCDQDKHKNPEVESEDPGCTNFYSRSSIIIAKKDEKIGVLHPPTDGQPGQDVFQKPIEHQAGTEFKVEPGKNVKLLADGRTFLALCDGEPKLEKGILTVDPTLTVKSDVDFTTGNIAFNGDVNIKGDIKDLFEVRTGGDLNVEGTVEAAHIECDGSLTVKLGISGKEKGLIKVQKNLSCKYLSNVTVWVENDAVVDSEIVNTDLNCRGKVVLKRGAIHGSQVCAAGNIESPAIGSPAGVRTIVRAAVDPFLERQIKELNQPRSELAERINNLMPRAKALLAACGGRPNQQLKKLADEIQKCKNHLEKIDRQHSQLLQEMNQKCNGIIIVHKMIYPGVILHLGNNMQIIEHQMTGPIEITVNRSEGEPHALAFNAPKESVAK